MKRKDVILWYISIGCFGVTLVPFVKFMFNLNVQNFMTALVFITASTIFYIIATKKVTHPKGFTTIQAMSFYKACKKQELGKPEQCRKRTVKFKEIASKYEFARNLDTYELFELYQTGYDLLSNRKDH